MANVPIGRIVAVDGPELTCLLSNEVMGDGQAATAPRVGMLVKMTTFQSTVYGVIGSMAMNPMPGAAAQTDHKFAQIDMMGEVLTTGDEASSPRFERGVSTQPTLGAAVYLAEKDDIALVYAKPSAHCVKIGHLHQESSIPAFVQTNDLLSKHMAVLGTTGSGKSCTVTLILQAILGANPCGHVVLLDPHNEYSQAFPGVAEVVDPSNLYLPYWLLNFEEMVTVLVREGDKADQQSQIAILRDALMEVKKKSASDDDVRLALTVDSPVPYRLSELVRTIDAALGRLDKPDRSAPFLRLKSRLESMSSDKRFSFMFSGLLVRDSMTEVLSRVLRIPVSGKPLTIMDLSGVPSEIVDVVVSVICRMTFDFNLWSAEGQAVPVLLVCEEAHRYIPRKDEGAFSSTKRAISRIAKEGRKYGVSLCLVTQRPSELDESILSQCGTLFSLRLGNDQDQDFVSRALPENARSLLSVLPSLRSQEAVVVGEGVTVPMRIRFDHLPADRRPRSGSANFAAAWQQDTHGADYLERSVRKWRLQQR
ncbi:MAG: hypothetical protein A2516_00585 [Alphaproteobacteria bacterium RIFOXYD12_FULL_60_8]|nr:MAG: hypothetical protein A2516_00585 [Alphaproteobacteria bacterium RIFOXYD12_FULL_60_8]